jgi:hypothetical protein
VLDADELLAAVTQASKDLNLHCISPHQARRRRSEDLFPGSDRPLSALGDKSAPCKFARGADA